MKADDAEGLWRLFQFNKGQATDFFNHVIGWPEAQVYCERLRYIELTGLRIMKKADLPRLEKYLKEFETLVLTA